jgi:hypothetical protein
MRPPKISLASQTIIRKITEGYIYFFKYSNKKLKQKKIISYNKFNSLTAQTQYKHRC